MTSPASASASRERCGTAHDCLRETCLTSSCLRRSKEGQKFPGDQAQREPTQTDYFNDRQSPPSSFKDFLKAQLSWRRCWRVPKSLETEKPTTEPTYTVLLTPPPKMIVIKPSGGDSGGKLVWLGRSREGSYISRAARSPLDWFFIKDRNDANCSVRFIH